MEYRQKILREDGEDNNNAGKQKAKKKKGPVFPFASLPDEVLLNVFRYLPFKDKCRLIRVNKRWNNLLKDKSLWMRAKIKVKCRGKKNKKTFRTNLVKFMKCRLPSSLVHLDVNIMSMAGLRYLDKDCPNLNSLAITLENGKITMIDIPNRHNLKSLEIRTKESGGEAREWWRKLKRVFFPRLESLSLDVERIHLSMLDNLCDDSVKLKLLIRDSLSTFTGLHHLKLSLDWGVYHSRGWGLYFQYLDPVVPSLETLHLDHSKYMYDSYTKSLPDDLYEYLTTCELKNIKTLHVPLRNHRPEANVKFLQDIAELPNLESLFLLSDVTMSTLKASLPRFVKLQDLHVVNVDGRFITEKHCLNHNENEDIFKSVVEEVMQFAPEMNLHLHLDYPFRTVRRHHGCSFRQRKLNPSKSCVPYPPGWVE